MMPFFCLPQLFGIISLSIYMIVAIASLPR